MPGRSQLLGRCDGFSKEKKILQPASQPASTFSFSVSLLYPLGRREMGESFPDDVILLPNVPISPGVVFSTSADLPPMT